jgi:nucleotide-binding universal stress UspA family protein
LNVQQPGENEDGASPQKQGRAIIENLVETAGIEGMQYDSRVEIAEDIERTILTAASEYDTICVGATRSGAVSQALFGSLPETIGEQSDRTVVMARGPEESAMSVRDAIVQRLES